MTGREEFTEAGRGGWLLIVKFLSPVSVWCLFCLLLSLLLSPSPLSSSLPPSPSPLSSLALSPPPLLSLQPALSPLLSSLFFISLLPLSLNPKVSLAPPPQKKKPEKSASRPRAASGSRVAFFCPRKKNISFRRPPGPPNFQFSFLSPPSPSPKVKKPLLFFLSPLFYPYKQTPSLFFFPFFSSLPLLFSLRSSKASGSHLLFKNQPFAASRSSSSLTKMIGFELGTRRVSLTPPAITRRRELTVSPNDMHPVLNVSPPRVAFGYTGRGPRRSPGESCIAFLAATIDQINVTLLWVSLFFWATHTPRLPPSRSSSQDVYLTPLPSPYPLLRDSFSPSGDLYSGFFFPQHDSFALFISYLVYLLLAPLSLSNNPPPPDLLPQRLVPFSSPLLSPSPLPPVLPPPLPIPLLPFPPA
ncbi:hypothetical protein C7M84_004208 [Penaeus vannamei]|uniref:Uncharacterized protein n=1 Tax=Penaeus vannamei TaxID=6689 RepID=A0A423TL62_PENVA|nr:hypothetical protein C7M84_004208 [Penaeus vannamei]